jgi:hypothetical protein
MGENEKYIIHEEFYKRGLKFEKVKGRQHCKPSEYLCPHELIFSNIY